jgi:predicted metal-dependent hydrolase
MSLRVGPAGVRLTVPPGVSRRRIEAFVRASADWVEERRAALPAPPPPLRDGDRLAYLDGELVLRVRPGSRATARRDGSALLVTTGSGTADTPVERWYRRELHRLALPQARALAEGLGHAVVRLSVRDGRSRWGSCSTTGHMSLSWRLLLAPRPVLDYVVAHEVCHLRHADHSPAFWTLLGTVAPGHDPARRWLRDHGHLLRAGPGWRAGGLAPAVVDGLSRPGGSG